MFLRPVRKRQRTAALQDASAVACGAPKVLECGCPLPLFPRAGGADAKLHSCSVYPFVTFSTTLRMAASLRSKESTILNWTRARSALWPGRWTLK